VKWCRWTGWLLAGSAVALASLAAELPSPPAAPASASEPAAAAPASPPACLPVPGTASCTAEAAYRCEVLYRLRATQRYLISQAPAGFVYDPGQAARAIETVLDGPADPAPPRTREAGADEMNRAGRASRTGQVERADWWDPVAARILLQLSEASALDPSAGRAEWLQTLDDLIALAQAFEILPQDQEDSQKDAVARSLPNLGDPAERPGIVSLWAGIRRTFRSHLERPRTGELCALEAPKAAAPTGRASAGAGRVLAHQGGLSRWPPNSLAALRWAHELGADGIECDLRLSADGEVFVLHDGHLADPAGGTLQVDKTPRRVLEGISLFDPFGLDRASAQTPLPLRTLLHSLGGKTLLWLELKADGGDALPERLGDLLAESALAPGSVIVSSLAAAEVAPLRRRFPDLLVAYEIVDVRPETVETLAAAPDSRRLIVSGLHFSTRSPAAFRRARELGLRTSSFTVNRFDALEQVLDAGVDYIQTDRPDRALWLRARRASGR